MNHNHNNEFATSGNYGNTNTVLKLPDGTMIQTYNIFYGDINTSSTNQNNEYSFNWPVQFVSKPFVIPSADGNLNQSNGVELREQSCTVHLGINELRSTNSICSYQFQEWTGNNQRAVVLKFLGIGRWK